MTANEAELRFEREGQRCVAAVGSYLFDAANRAGVYLDADCGRRGECDSCALEIRSGGEFLSAPTKMESEHPALKSRKVKKRLACQAKITARGEIAVMTEEKKAPEKNQFEEFRKEFAELPLDEKVKNLLDLEVLTLGETFSYILNLPYTIGGKIRDAMAEVGMQMDEAEKKARKPEEHQEEPPKEEKKTAARKRAPRKTAAPKKAADSKPTPRKRAKKAETPKTE